MQKAHEAIESVAAVVLAAGAGRRMGGRPKALLLRQGEPLVARQVRLLAEAGVRDTTVALGHHAACIAPVLAALPQAGGGLRWVVNPTPDAGPAASLRAALAAVPPTVAGVLVLLADQPLLELHDLQAVLQAWHARPAGVELVLPTHQGQPGHPLVFGPRVRQAVLQGQAVRDWRRTHGPQVLALAAEHPRYTCDVDDEQARAALATRHGVWLSWPHEGAAHRLGDGAPDAAPPPPVAGG